MRNNTVRTFSRLHRRLYRATNGRVGRRLPRIDAPMLLLTTTGRRSGKPHTVPLLFLSEGDGWLVIASYGGRDHHPAWYLNLVADPSCTVQVDGKSAPATATTLDADARTQLWPKVVAAYDGYAAYQAKTERQIPLVLLTPTQSSS